MATTQPSVTTSPFANITGNPAVASGISVNSGQITSPFQTPSNLTSFTNSLKVPQSNANIASALLGSGPLTTQSVQPTASGGVSFHPSIAAAYSTPAQNVDNSGGTSNPNYNYTAGVPQSGAAGLAPYTHTGSQTPNGGTVSINGNGTASGYSPSGGYSIDTSGTAPSSALTGQNTASGLQNSYNSYADLVNGVSQAQGYNQNYIGALQSQYGAQTQGAQLGLNQAQYGMNSANINANYATGIGTTGLTGSQAQTLTGQEQALNAQGQAGNTLAQAGNSIQQLAANQALNTQQLARTGAISAAQTQLQYSPEGISGQNALNQVNALQQAHPDAGIIPYASSGMSPEEYQQYAMNQVAHAPSFQAQYQTQYSTPGGGTGIYNKLNVGGLPQNQDGTISLVNAGQAALGGANASALTTQVQNYNNVQTSFNTANKTLGTMIQFMQQNGINDNSLPILNQLNNKVKAGLLQPGVIAAYQADIAELDTNYSTILARGGSVAGTNDAAAKLINPDLKPADLQQVLGQLTQNGKNALDAAGGQISQLTGQLGGQSSGYSGGSTQNSSSGWGSLGD